MASKTQSAAIMPADQLQPAQTIAPTDIELTNTHPSGSKADTTDPFVVAFEEPYDAENPRHATSTPPRSRCRPAANSPAP